MASKLEAIRERLPFIDGKSIRVVSDGEGTSHIWTFAGGLANAALAQGAFGHTTRWDDFSVRLRSGSHAVTLDTFSRLDAASIHRSPFRQLVRELKFAT